MLVKHLPADSAFLRLANDGETPWRTEHYLLSHVYTALTGKPHPALPKPSKAAAQSRHSSRVERLEAQRQRIAAARATAP